MLCCEGIRSSPEHTFSVIVCEHCNASINPKKNANLKLPKFALANKLYWGSLPDKFRDLTWVEEQAIHTGTILPQVVGKSMSKLHVVRGHFL